MRISRLRFALPALGLGGIMAVVLPISAGLVVQIGQNFTGSTYGIDSPYVPPDCNGFAGPFHYVELINGRYSVYAKTNGTRVQTMSSASFWSGTGIPFSGETVSDPRVVYDKLSQRWFAAAIDVQFGNESSNRFLLAVSTSANPTGQWTGLSFPADPVNGDFADFPTLGLDANGVYLAALMFSGTSGSLLGNTLVSIPKTNLVSATPTVANRTSFGLVSAANYGSVLQPAIHFAAGTTAARILAVGDLGYDFAPHFDLVSATILNATGPGVATLSSGSSLSVPAYEVPINPPQPDGSDNLDDGDTRFGANVHQVNGLLYAAHCTQFQDRAAVRWYKIDASTLAVLQSGTIADPSLNFFYPSISANEAGTVVIAYNGCDANTFVSVFASVGETSGGTTVFQAPRLLKAGVASYQRPGSSGISRWGDYTATCVDPIDPNRFWTIQMYPSSGNAWSTQITEILTGYPVLEIARTGTNVVLSWPVSPLNLQLQSVTNITSANWLAIPGTPVTTNHTVSLELVPSAPGEYFRLNPL